MFSQKIVASDAFLDMPISSQCLYFHLGMYADDDGFINPKKIMRLIGASEDDLKVLLGKRFVISFENGVVVIKHWKINNLIRKDFYEPTIYDEQKKLLNTKENKAYTESQQNVDNLATQVRLGKDRLDKVSIGESGDKSPTPAEEAKNFFNYLDKQLEVIKWLVEKGVPQKVAQDEVKEFVGYWTERNKAGTKQRWELQKTFELRRRFATWFKNYNIFNKNSKAEKGTLVL